MTISTIKKDRICLFINYDN